MLQQTLHVKLGVRVASYWFVGCCVVVISLAACGCSSSTDAASAEASRVDALVERVVHAEDEGAAQQAMEEIQSMGSGSADALRRVFQESTQPEVRIQAAQAIADACVLDAVPDLIDTLDESDANIRRASDEALRKMLVISVRYDPQGTPEDRRAAIELYRDYWNRRNTPEMNAIGNDPEKAKKAMEQQTIFQ